MVDSVQGIGSVKGIAPTNKAQKTEKDSHDARETSRSEAAQDEVSVSFQPQEFADDAQASQVAQYTRELLERDDNVTLGLNRQFLREDA